MPVKAVFIDFEMNPIKREQRQARRICAGEIIEIGAVKLNEQGKEISSYKEYVRPEYTTEMDNTCQQLTGITMSVLSRADHFRTVYKRFLKWCNAEEVNNYEIYAWSESDWRQLNGELLLKQMDITDANVRWMLAHWQNFQQIYCNILGLDQVISLDKAVSTLGEKFDGQMHDALWDARNTSKLYVISKEKKELNKIIKPILEATKPSEPLTYSLADAFQTARER
jgi:inhibitor of KinA sporulation pathway (predicted exonuclease)